MAACWGCVGWNVSQRRPISPVNLARNACSHRGPVTSALDAGDDVKIAHRGKSK